MPTGSRALLSNLLTAAGVVAIVGGVVAFGRTGAGRWIERFLPTPFWIYFFSILLGVSGLFPDASPVFSWLGLYGLLCALFLLLVGAPIHQLARMGAQASASMAIATGSMMVACVAAYLTLVHWLPADSWKSVGALAGTWIGGSANMIAVKEVLRLEDANLAPLVIVDTLLSYTWMAALLAGVGWQSRFDVRQARHQKVNAISMNDSSLEKRSLSGYAVPVVAGLAAAFLVAAMGRWLAARQPFFSATGWSVLLMSMIAVGLALTPVRRLERFGASSVGTYALYAVLVSIAAKTRIESISAAPLYLALGAVILVLHGLLLLILGRWFRLPLFLLSTASQANVGGMASAPIVAAAYRPGAAAIGVLMAILGTVVGTYLGVATGAVCRFLAP